MSEERSIYDFGSGAIGILEAEIVKRDAEIARLHTDLDGARAALRQAQADVGWWHATVANYVTSATVEDRALLRATLAEATTYPHPGAALMRTIRNAALDEAATNLAREVDTAYAAELVRAMKERG